jgi:hypothetical protein
MKGGPARLKNWKRLAAEEAGLPGIPEPGPTRQLAHAHPKDQKSEGSRVVEWELPDEWAAVKTRGLQGKYRFFARLRDFDFACPRCGEIYLVRHRGRKPKTYSGSRLIGGGGWDPVLHRMTCRVCNLKVALGIVACSVGIGGPAIPDDVMPTLQEMVRLRAAKLGGEWEPSRVARKGVRVNRLTRVREGE